MKSRDFSLSMILTGQEKALFKGILRVFSRMGDITLQHSSSYSYETALVSLQLAHFLKLPASTLRDIFYCALLLDVGEICFDHRWFEASPEAQRLEKEKLREHPLLSARIIQKIPTLSKASSFALFHHEWHNGMGYPYGKKGGEIPLESQIISIADTYSKNQMMMESADVLDMLYRMRGVQFSPQITEAFIDMSLAQQLWSPATFDSNVWSVLQLDLIDMAMLLDYQGDYLKSTLEVLSDTIDAKHTYTFGHSERVAKFAELIAEKAGFSGDRLNEVVYGALLHDVGKVSVPRYILDKQTPLSTEEWKMIQDHPRYSHDLISPISGMEGVAQVAKYHHERFRGKGYPEGLTGEDIPMGSRIVAVADAFDAITSKRPYNKGFFDKDYAYRELKGDNQGWFDPDIVALFMDIPRKEIDELSYKAE